MTRNKRSRRWSSIPGPAAITQGVALAGLSSYLALQLAYDAYYSGLGVTSEDVGLGYATVLTHASVGVILVVFAATGYICLSAASRAIVGIRKWLLDRSKRKVLVNLFIAALAVSVLLVIVNVFHVDYAIQQQPAKPWVWWLGSAAGVFWFSDRFIARLRTDNTISREVINQVVVVQIAVLLAIGLFALHDIGSRYARDVRRGVILHPTPILSVRAEQTRIVWIDGKSHCDVSCSAKVRYIGHNESTYTLYDLTRQAAIRIPIAAVVLER